MKKNIKLEIIQIAKKLFNERGYNDVSTQNISDALGISKGNLNYHFKRKEDILEAVVEEMHSHYVKPAVPATLKELNELFLRTQKVAKENAFYFWHYTQFSQMSEKIRDIQSTVIQDNHTLYSEAFRLLNKGGALQNEEYPGQYEHIIHAIMLSCIYWTPHSRLEENMGTQRDFLDNIWGILYPLLTDEGKVQYSTMKNS